MIPISDFPASDRYGFHICFALHLKPSPLWNDGLDIDEKHCDAQLGHQITLWLLKLHQENQNANLKIFVEIFHTAGCLRE